MELNGSRNIPATVEQTWAALNDPEVLKRCISGCESLERVGEDGLQAVVALKVGPVSARFKGSVKLLNVQAPHSYTLQFDGQGGVAGFGKGSADVSLAPAAEAGPGQTQLSYTARATVGGKMAQVGSRLVDAAAGKITEDFFSAFVALLSERHAAPADAMPADVPTAGATTAVATAANPLPTGAAPADAPHAAQAAPGSQPVLQTLEGAAQADSLAATAGLTAGAPAATLASASARPTAVVAAAAAPAQAPVATRQASGGNGLKWAAVALLAAFVLYFVLR
jgi:uncharacterized protein